jgi:predicted ArsR family transcriptional regulator
MDKIQKRMRDENNGHWQKYPRELFIQVVDDKGGEATTSEITAEVGCSDMTTRRKMHDLEEEGVVESREIGTVLVWRFVDDSDY